MSRDRPNGRIRVMRIISRMNIGGPSIHVVMLNAGLSPDTYDSLLVTGTESATEGSLKDLATAQQLRLVTIPELGRDVAARDDLVALYKLFRLMRRERPHIVHTHLAKAGFVGRLAARLAGVPIVVHTYHGHVFHGYFSPTMTRVYLLMETAIGRLSTRLVTISDRLREEIAGFGVADRAKISVIPLGFDLDPFLRASRERGHGRFRAALGFAEGDRAVGIVGRLVKIKNLPLFLDAAALARRQHPPLRFVVVGDGELRGELAAYAGARGLADRVSFVGWRRDMPEIYADLDAVVISSDNEGTPVSLIEAMAAGCPVIATAVGGVPDLIADGETGRLVPPGDAEALARAIGDLVEQPAAVRAMADRAQGAILERFRATRLVADIDGLYRRLLAAKRVRLPSAAAEGGASA